MCLLNLEGLCVKKLEAENPIPKDIFEEHHALTEQQVMCRYQCNGYNILCPLYQEITSQDVRNLTSLTTAL